MQIRVSINGAGDFRLVKLPDVIAKRETPDAGGPALVRSDVVQEMTTSGASGPRAGFGKVSTRNTFTRYARRFLRECGAVLDCGRRENSVFMTGTLPGGTPEAFEAIAAWSGWIVQTLLQWAYDVGGSRKVMGVWEWQKRGALHIHLVVNCESGLKAGRLKQQFKRRWIRCLDVVSRRAGVDLFQRADGSSWKKKKSVTRTDAQTVEKSVSSYLGKYLSKHSDCARRQAVHPPSRWFFVSKAVQEAARLRRQSIQVSNLPPAQAQELWETIGAEVAEQAAKLLSYVSPYDIRIQGIVALLTPIHASALYNSIMPILNCLCGVHKVTSQNLSCTLERAAALFCGELIRGSPVAA